MSKVDVALLEIKQSLDQLGLDITQGKYAALVLRDLKSAVDQLRLTLWAIIEFHEQNKQDIQNVPEELGKKFVEFRTKRLEQMLNDLRGDFTNGAVDRNHPELKNLAGALQTTLHSITHLPNRKA